MGSLIQQLITTLTTFPGNLAYHLILAFAITGALFVSLLHWQNSEFPQGRRMVIGLGILLAIRLLFFASSGLAWQGLVESFEFLPPLDRAVTTLSIIIIIMLWVFPEPSRASTTASGLLVVFTLVFLAFTLVSWQASLVAWTERGFENRLFFNQTNFLRSAWELIPGILLILALILIFIRQPNSWAIGAGMFGLMLLGHSLELFFPVFQNDYPGIVRLFLLISYPVLFTLPSRFPLRPGNLLASETVPLTVERRSYSTESETFRAFLALSTEENPSNICEAFTRTVSNLLLADVCFLVTLIDQEQELIFECGYDLIREQGFPGTSFDESVMPVLCAALRRGRTLKLPASSTSPDLLGLAHALGLESAGHLLAMPIPVETGEQIQGVVLLSPYSNRAWSFDDEVYLREAAEALGLMARQRHRQAFEQENLQATLHDLEIAREEAEAVRVENESLRGQLMALQEQQPTDPGAAESLAALLAAQEESQEIIQQLQAEIEALQVEASKIDPDELAIQPVAGILPYELEDLEPEALQEAEERASVSSPMLDESDLTEISSISQDLRQPMSSIVGYADLLLSESVGILGTLQVKFLERIKASVERMRAMTDDLIQITAVEGSPALIDTEPVDLSIVIDDAIAFTRAQLSEKNIALRVDLPDSLPELTADRDALQQILIHLLQNAGSVTPSEGEIALRARLEKNGTDSHVLLQVSDTGDGIPNDDLPRVFSRLYHAEKALIKGVSDTGVGLAIAKTLVEAHHGQIWVDSKEGDGSTFSVKLPLFQPTLDNNGLEGSPL